MRPMWIVMAALALAAVGCGGGERATRQESVTTSAAQPAKAEPRVDRCPAGHETLKTVPVVYGPVEDPAKIQKGEEALELIYGGSLALDGAPKEVLVCATCRYQHDAAHGFWKRSGSKPADFAVPLEPFIAEVKPPRPRDLVRGPLYEQYLKGDNRWEYVSFRSKEKWQYVAANLDAHILKFKLFDAITTREGEEKRIVITGKWKYYDMKVEVRAEGEEGYGRVEISKGSVWDEKVIQQSIGVPTMTDR